MKYQSFLFIKSIAYLTLALCVTSCKKNWLDAKPEKALVVPSSLRDYQALLDNNIGGLAPFNDKHSMFEEIGADDFYVTTDGWKAAPIKERNAYIWASDIFGSEKGSGDWEVQYSCVLYANIILEGIEKIIPANNAEQLEWNQVKGSALFFRAHRHFVISQGYCKPYDKNESKSDLGIPLRLQSDFNKISIRSTVEDTYNSILNDLKKASEVLPIEKPKADEVIYKMRPTKAAAYAMLARVYLSMGLYDSAFKYSDKTLALYNTLIDYNTVTGGLFKFQRFNPEVIFHITGSSNDLLATTKLIVDSSLLKSYLGDDLRPSLFFLLFQNAFRFVGNYTATGTFFTGLATDEMYLIRAECYARGGNKTAALSDLNTLIKLRWKKTVTYPGIDAIDAKDALQKILQERRKELCFRNIRWSDLRRLNKAAETAKTVSRIVDGQLYTLQPNSPKYVLPIPTDVIQLTGMEQNLR